MKSFYVATHPVDPAEISAYRDGDLEDSRRRIVERHVEDCTNCRERLLAYELVGSELRARADITVPSSLDRRVGALAASHREPRRWRFSPVWTLRPAWVVVALALMVAATLFYGLPFTGNGSGPLVAAAYLYSDQGEPAIEVHFSEPVNRDEVARTLRIEPAVELNVGWRGDTMVVKPVEPIQPAREYTLSLKPSGPESSATPVALHFAGDTPSTPVALVTPPAAAIAPSATPSATATTTATPTPRSTQLATASPAVGSNLPGLPQSGGTATPSPTATSATPQVTTAPTTAASPAGGTPGTTTPTTATPTTPAPTATTPTATTATDATPTMVGDASPTVSPTMGVETPAETATPPTGPTDAIATPAPTVEEPVATPSATMEQPLATRTPIPPRATAAPTNTALPTATATAAKPPEPAAGRAYETASAKSPMAAARLGTPSTEERKVTLSHQDFQLGAMLWQADTREILMLQDDGAWTIHRDTWNEQERLTYSGPVPPGVTVPSGRFGKLWSSTPDVRLALGWATAAEHSLVGAVQDFTGGRLLMEGEKLVYALYPDGSWEAFGARRIAPPIEPSAAPVPPTPAG